MGIIFIYLNSNLQLELWMPGPFRLFINETHRCKNPAAVQDEKYPPEHAASQNGALKRYTRSGRCTKSSAGKGGSLLSPYGLKLEFESYSFILTHPSAPATLRMAGAMAKTERRSTFVVVTGNPQEGQGNDSAKYDRIWQKDIISIELRRTRPEHTFAFKG
jgi:hypothetical protein